MSESTIGSRTMTAALEDALLDDNIKGVVIRLDSPGGSALASEVIWQSVRELKAAKPVYCVIGNMAASGGYYIACATDRIYIQPHSILGSIGVVAGKMTLGGLYDWAGIHVHRRTRGPGGDLFSSVDPFTDEQRELLRDAMTLTYEQFKDRVREGRGDKLPDLDAVDEGMLFTGTQSVANGLAGCRNTSTRPSAAACVRPWPGPPRTPSSPPCGPPCVVSWARAPTPRPPRWSTG